MQKMPCVAFTADLLVEFSTYCFPQIPPAHISKTKKEEMLPSANELL